MELYRADHPVISGGYFRSHVPIMERVVAFGSLRMAVRQDCCLLELPVVQESEGLLPKFPQVIKLFHAVQAPELRTLASSLYNRLHILITPPFATRPDRSSNRTLKLGDQKDTPTMVIEKPDWHPTVSHQP